MYSGPVLALIRVDKDQLGSFIRHSLAVELYREGRLSLGKAAELAGAKSKWEMLMLLSESGVPLDYTAKDAEMTCGRWSSAGPMIAVCNSTPLIALPKTKFATREIRNT